MEKRNDNPLSGWLDGAIGMPAEVADEESAKADMAEYVQSIDDVGEYRPEQEDDNVLIYGPWLERGGSAGWISTSGTGKSIISVQFAMCMTAGIPFCGLKPRKPLGVWVFQTEDSPRRIAQDREDVTAELTEREPGYDWMEIRKRVKFVKMVGKTGGEFIAWLDGMLAKAAKAGEMPDVIVLNPLHAFVGGNITDSVYVTPFLRGGLLPGNVTTKGMQYLITKHRVGLLVFHHTPKPPSDKDLDAWLKSSMPEYQGAGSAELTNWFRSCVTMLRVKGHSRIVCVTAGKNGGELGWEEIGGAHRHYLAYSDAVGISGKRRHAWRELEQDERDEIIKPQVAKTEEDAELIANNIAQDIKQNGAAKVSELRDRYHGAEWGGKYAIRSALNLISSNPDKYRLTVQSVVIGKKRTSFIGLVDSIREKIDAERERARYNAAMAQNESTKQEELDPYA